MKRITSLNLYFDEDLLLLKNLFLTTNSYLVRFEECEKLLIRVEVDFPPHSPLGPQYMDLIREKEPFNFYIKGTGNFSFSGDERYILEIYSFTSEFHEEIIKFFKELIGSELDYYGYPRIKKDSFI